MSLLVLGHEADGLGAALALAHQGFPVHVLDRGPDPREPGGGRQGAVAIAPDGMRELALLGLLDQVTGHATVPDRLVHADAADGRVLRSTDLGHQVVTRYGYPYMVTRRAVLRTVLATACAADEMISVEYGRSAIGVDDVGDGVLVTCDDGSVYHAEALIGADGPASPVRSALEAGPALSRPYIRYDAVGPPASRCEIRLWSSPDLHIMQAPVPGGTELAVILRVDPHDELRHVSSEKVLARLLAESHADVQRVTAGLDGTPPAQVHRHQAPLGEGRHRRLTVAGTAASPMLPHTALGTTSALLDAGALGRAFDRADGRILDALTSYVGARHQVWARQADLAYEFATICHADGLVRRMRDRLWANTPLDDMAAIIGSVPAGPPSAAAGWRG